MAAKPEKPDKTRTEPGQKKTDGTVQLTAEELRKISGGASGNPGTKTTSSDTKTGMKG
jgi:hypothetical protein